MEPFGAFLRTFLEDRAKKSDKGFSVCVSEFAREVGGTANNVSAEIVEQWLENHPVDEFRRMPIGRLTGYDFCAWDIYQALQAFDGDSLGWTLHPDIQKCHTAEDLRQLCIRLVVLVNAVVLERLSGISHQSWSVYALKDPATARTPSFPRLAAVFKAAHLVLSAETAGKLRELRQLPKAKQLKGKSLKLSDIDLTLPSPVDSTPKSTPAQVPPVAPVPAAPKTLIDSNVVADKILAARVQDSERYSNKRIASITGRPEASVRRWYSSVDRRTPPQDELHKIVEAFPELFGTAEAQAAGVPAIRPIAMVSSNLIGAAFTGVRSTVATLSEILALYPDALRDEMRGELARVVLDLVKVSEITPEMLAAAAHGLPIEPGSPLYKMIRILGGK